MSSYDDWLVSTLPGDTPDYDYKKFVNLPYYYNSKTRRWHDAETHEIVSEDTAIRANDDECEKQDERNRYYADHMGDE